MIEEGFWAQANDDTSHEFARMAHEPTGALVRLNEGTPFEAAGTTVVREQMARLESMLRMDVRVLEKSPDPVRYRRDMEAAHVRGMIKQWHKIVFASRDAAAGTAYGDMDADPKSINGLRKRLAKLTSATSPFDNVRSLGGSTANEQSSIYLVKHGPEGLFFFYPRTASRTLQVNDLREQIVYDASSNPYRAVMTQFAWEFGMGIADPRSVQRLANIATAQTAGSFGDDTDKEQGEKALIDMIERLPGGDTTNCAFYAGPEMMAAMRKRLNSKANMFFTEETVWGRPMLAFMGVPFIRVDNLKANEAVVS
jgi:hypothetical protein